MNGTFGPYKVRPFFFVLFLFTASVLTFFLDLGVMPVWSDNEGQRATPPIEMLASREYVIPTINGADYLTKPPLLYWMIAASYKLSGTVSELTARIPTALSATMLVLSLYLLSNLLANDTIARGASILILACPYFLERSRWTEIDVPFTCALFFSTSLLYSAHKTPNAGRATFLAVLAGGAFAAALLLKGPPAFLFLFATVVAIWVTWGEFSSTNLQIALWGSLAASFLAVLTWLIAFRFPIPLLLFLATWLVVGIKALPRKMFIKSAWVLFVCLGVSGALVSPWIIALLERRSFSYVASLLHTEALERTYLASEINSGSPLYYVLGVIAMAAPWSLLLPLLFFPGTKKKTQTFPRFSLIYMCLAVGCFSMVAGKEYEYILPVFPYLAITMSDKLNTLLEQEKHCWQTKVLRVWSNIMLPLLCVILVGCAVYYVSCERVAALSFRLFPLTLLGLGIAFSCRRTVASRLVTLCVLTLLVTLAVLLGRGYELSKPNRSPKFLGTACRDLIEHGFPLETARRLGSTQPFPYPALAFYVRHVIPFEDSPEKVIQKLRGKEPYFYLLREKTLQDVLFEAHRDVFDIKLGPFDRKNLLVIGNAALPDTPAIAQARALSGR